MAIALLLIGLLVGGLAAWIALRGRSAAALARVQSEASSLRAELEIERRSSGEKLALVEQSNADWEKRFQALSAAALKSNTSSILELTHAQLAPLAEMLKQFDEQSQQVERDRRQAYGALFQQVNALAEGQEKLRTETGNLVSALRKPHFAGSWGQMQLRRVLEVAGMLNHCDFTEQSSTRDGEGALLRPDVIVNLAGGKRVVIDAKAPLDSYLSAHASEDPDEQRGHLDRHAQLVKKHVAELSAKRYWAQFDDAPEFVVMFLPDEGLLRAALDRDGTIVDTAAAARVIPATPTTLIALLLIVAYGWKQEKIAEGARKVNALGRELYDRLGTFLGHVTKLGRSLETAGGAYNDMIGSLEKRVLPTARKFADHGAGADELPEVATLTSKPRSLIALEAGDDTDVDGLESSAA
jgi:DNA recombination protein RmuC